MARRGPGPVARKRRPGAEELSRRSAWPRVWDPTKIVIILDHRVPAESEKTATTHKAIREFVREQGIRNFYDVGRGGICHQVLAENGHVQPGMVVVGTDSHTTTHGAFGAFAAGIGATEMAGVWTEGELWFKVPSTIRIEVDGELRPWISAKDLILYIIGQAGRRRRRLSRGRVRRPGHPRAERGLAHGAGEPLDGDGRQGGLHAGGRTLWIGRRAACVLPFARYAPDADARYERVIEIDASEASEPQVACPHAVDNVKPLSALGRTCRSTRPCSEAAPTAAWRISRSRRASSPARRVHARTRLIVIPASQDASIWKRCGSATYRPWSRPAPW